MKAVNQKLKFKGTAFNLALDIVQRLKEQGFKESFFVGGAVRDSLLEISPKDFDIATDAKPNQIKRYIKNCFVVGKRFKLALAKREPYEFEISTFRKKPTAEQELKPLVKDNQWGTAKEDAFRRDFTINALAYDPIQYKIYDYTEQGLADLKTKIIRTIGNPYTRVQEDPIRILRAVRLSYKVEFQICNELKSACKKHGELLKITPLSRRREEFLKFLRLKNNDLPWVECHHLGLLAHMTPTLEKNIFSNYEKTQQFLQGLQKFSEAEAAHKTETEALHKLPTYLIAKIIFCYCNTHMDIWNLTDREQEELSHFAKQELGSSNDEIDFTLKALSLFKTIQKPFNQNALKHLEKKQDALSLALLLLEMNNLCDSRHLQTWWKHTLSNKKSTPSQTTNAEKASKKRGKQSQKPKKKKN